MSPNMSSQLITKKHYMVSPNAMHSSLHKSFCFHFISYSKVLKLQKWWSWWWRGWLRNNVITPESLSYRITLYHTDRHMPLTHAVLLLRYILVCPALPSSLSWRFLNFVFFFRWALKASPKASYQEKQTESKLSTNMQKYLWWLFNIYCLILLFVIVMLIVMMPYKKLMRSWFCCWLLWAFRTRLLSWKC